jgi:hypothetical protein
LIGNYRERRRGHACDDRRLHDRHPPHTHL